LEKFDVTIQGTNPAKGREASPAEHQKQKGLQAISSLPRTPLSLDSPGDKLNFSNNGANTQLDGAIL